MNTFIDSNNFIPTKGTKEQYKTALRFLVYDRVINTTWLNDVGKKTLIGNAFDFMYSLPVDLKSEFTSNFIEECGNAYNGNNSSTRISGITALTASCPKGIIERFVSDIKPILLTACLDRALGEDNEEQQMQSSTTVESNVTQKASRCQPIYLQILKEVFNMEIGVPDFDKNESTQRWSAEVLDTIDENQEYQQLPADGNQRPDYLRNSYREFMRNAYRRSNREPDETVINNETTMLDQAGVFQNATFGGRRRILKTRKAYKCKTAYKCNKRNRSKKARHQKRTAKIRHNIKRKSRRNKHKQIY